MSLKIGPSNIPRRERYPGDPSALLSNAEVGLAAERGMAYRSFLQFPIEYKFGDMVQDDMVVLDEEALLDDPRIFMHMLGRTAARCIDEAFETGGWGAWTPLHRKTVAEKTSRGVPKPAAILIDSGQLRSSIMFELSK